MSSSSGLEQSPSSELQHVTGVWQRMQGSSPIYDFLFPTITLVSATKGSIKAHLTLGPNHVNSRGTLHGAVTAAIVDWSGGLAIATHGLEKTGASVDIHVTYLATARVDEVIEIEATANKVGKSMAFTTIKVSKLVDGEVGAVVATASHTKFVQLVQQEKK